MKPSSYGVVTNNPHHYPGVGAAGLVVKNSSSPTSSSTMAPSPLTLKLQKNTTQADVNSSIKERHRNNSKMKHEFVAVRSSGCQSNFTAGAARQKGSGTNSVSAVATGSETANSTPTTLLEETNCHTNSTPSDYEHLSSDMTHKYLYNMEDIFNSDDEDEEDDEGIEQSFTELTQKKMKSQKQRALNTVRSDKNSIKRTKKDKHRHLQSVVSSTTDEDIESTKTSTMGTRSLASSSSSVRILKKSIEEISPTQT